ncbi:MAG: M48 family metallopeptidase [Zoogloeaceae bacterium]|jgi:predicted Zn-dependent protease|nr:M48 family metallopeptidase [Zoogloeaceae bacterium]
MDDGKKTGLVAFLAVLLFFSGCSTLETRPADDASTPSTSVGVDVGELSSIRTIVSAQNMEAQADREYRKLLKNAQDKDNLVGPDDVQAKRLTAITDRIIPVAKAISVDAVKYANVDKWTWEVNLIRSNEINAFCMPGGKIAFYTGLIDKLQATDDELAIVLGHEVAHALREHARAQVAKGQLTSLGTGLLGIIIGKGQYARVFGLANDMLNLKFSRGDETEADLVGLELAARAGYNPHAGISLWQKMGKASSGMSIPWFSTHPSSESRIKDIEAQLPKVMPLYEQAKSPEPALDTKQQAKGAEQTPNPVRKPERGAKKATQKPAKKTEQGR